MLQIPADIFDAMVQQARDEAPAECCGLLAGKSGTVTVRYPLRNELASPVAYFAEPRGLLDAFRDMRERALDLVAIYHSHPTCEARPSRVDIDENYFEDLPRIIISLTNEPPVVKAFRLFADGFDELRCVRSAN